MIKRQFPTHYYHAFGYGFGAQIHHPFCEPLPAQASAAIPSTGGFATASASAINHREIIRIDTARTVIATSEETDSYDTVVTASIENLNIFNQVTADRIVAHLASKTLKKKAPMSFRTIGAAFVNLRIGGVPVEVALEDEDGSNYAGPKPISNNPVFDAFDPAKGRTNAEFGEPAHLTTLVRSIRIGNDRAKCHGNAIVVPDFGVVYLAEYLVTSHARQLNMLRVELGCAVHGKGSGPGAGSNGTTIPPPP